jgi:phosphatidylinositol glycan class B
VAYAGVRTYSNCLEALVVALAFAARPETTRGWGALGLLLGTGALVRPTTLLFAVPLAARPLLERREARVVALVIGVGMALSVGIVLDSAIYGALTVTPLNFLRVNLLSGVSAAYGVHVWHWYASEAMPALVGPWLLPLIAWIAHGGAASMSREAWWPVAAALLSLAVLSVSPHKELRFALPALYLVLPLCGKAAHALHDRLVVKAAGGSRGRGLFWLGAAIVLACNVGAAFFFARVHQVGTIDVMERISERAALRGEDGHRYEVELLMPCHSTPLFSHAHSADPLRRALLRTLDCSPDLALRSRNATESASFESNPLAFVARRYATVPLPDAIVVFDTHADALKAWLRGSGFELRDTLFHAMLGEHRQVLYWERTAIAPR